MIVDQGVIAIAQNRMARSQKQCWRRWINLLGGMTTCATFLIRSQMVVVAQW